MSFCLFASSTGNFFFTIFAFTFPLQIHPCCRYNVVTSLVSLQVVFNKFWKIEFWWNVPIFWEKATFFNKINRFWIFKENLFMILLKFWVIFLMLHWNLIRYVNNLWKTMHFFFIFWSTVNLEKSKHKLVAALIFFKTSQISSMSANL